MRCGLLHAVPSREIEWLAPWEKVEQCRLYVVQHGETPRRLVTDWWGLCVLCPIEPLRLLGINHAMSAQRRIRERLLPLLCYGCPVSVGGTMDRARRASQGLLDNAARGVMSTRLAVKR